MPRPVEEIDAAIKKLLELKENSTAGDWRHQVHTDFPYEPGYLIYLAPVDGAVFGSQGDIAWACTPKDAALIATLNRTLDAQIKILRSASADEEEARQEWEAIGKPHLRGPAKIVPINMAALELAREINRTP